MVKLFTIHGGHRIYWGKFSHADVEKAKDFLIEVIGCRILATEPV